MSAVWNLRIGLVSRKFSLNCLLISISGNITWTRSEEDRQDGKKIEVFIFLFFFVNRFDCCFFLQCFTIIIIKCKASFSCHLSGYHADTPITIKAEPSIWLTAAFINIHEHPI